MEKRTTEKRSDGSTRIVHQKAHDTGLVAIKPINPATYTMLIVPEAKE